MEPIPESPFEALLEAISERNAEAAQAMSDGRRMRTERGRAAVVEELLALVNQGIHPTVAEIAEQSGVSERTVFRYFPDRESMYIAIAVEIFPKIAHCFSLKPPKAGLDERLRGLVQLRVEMTEVAGKYADWVESTDKPTIAQTTITALRREQMRRQIAVWLAPELSDDRSNLGTVINAMLTQRPIGMILEELSPEQTTEVLVNAVRRILAND